VLIITGSAIHAATLAGAVVVGYGKTVHTRRGTRNGPAVTSSGSSSGPESPAAQRIPARYVPMLRAVKRDRPCVLLV